MNLDFETEKLLKEIFARCCKDPAFIEQVIHAATRGIVDGYKEANDHAADIEVVAKMAMSKKLFGNNDAFIAEKLERWAYANRIKWDDEIAELRKRAEKKKEDLK